MRTVRDRAERLRQLIHSGAGSPTGDGLQQTAAYIDLLFAFGLARLGEAECGSQFGAAGRARRWKRLAARRTRSCWRRSAIASTRRSPASRTPGLCRLKQLEYLEQMRREAETLCQKTILGGWPPTSSIGCLSNCECCSLRNNSTRIGTSSRSRTNSSSELVALPALHDRKQIADRVRSLVARAAKSRVPDTRVRVLAETLSMAGRVGADLGGELLAQVGPALDAVAALPQDAYLLEKSVRLLERAVLFAAHFDLPELVKAFTDRLGRILESPAGRGILEPLGKLVAEALRGLRKLGLKDHAERLLQQVERTRALAGQPLELAQSRAGGEWQETLRLLLDLAAGWLYLDRPDEGRPVLDAARAWILNPNHKSNDLNRPPRIPYTAVVCAVHRRHEPGPVG